MSETFVQEAEHTVENVFHKAENFFDGLVSKLPHRAADLQPVAAAASDVASKFEQAAEVVVEEVLKDIEGLLPSGPLASLAGPMIDKIITALQAKKTS